MKVIKLKAAIFRLLVHDTVVTKMAFLIQKNNITAVLRMYIESEVTYLATQGQSQQHILHMRASTVLLLPAVITCCHISSIGKGRQEKTIDGEQSTVNPVSIHTYQPAVFKL